MRLRNIPEAAPAIENSIYCVKNASTMKGKWHTLFKNKNSIHIEIGMGKGKFLMQLAKEHPEINYIGIERYTSVLFRAVQKMDVEPLPNLYFICEDASKITDLFAPAEVDRIYLNFSDPWPKDRHARRRLTSKDFLELYDKILSPDGRLEFKTDNRYLFAFSVDQIYDTKPWQLDAVTWDLHNDSVLNINNIMTEYEEKFSSCGHPICKMICSR